MKKIAFWTGILLLTGSLVAGPAMAQSEADVAVDITKEVIMGPGSVGIQTTKDILMSFGARSRIIPTMEGDWDFGLSDDTGSDLFTYHANESGWINNNYIRMETQLYFNALPKDRNWSFYAALEFDRPLENASVDERGGKTFESSNFGLERLHGSYKLPMNMRLHAGFDIWAVDAIDAAGLVYGDDNPGIWLTGDYDNFSFNVAYIKLSESNFQTSDSFTQLGGKDDDRDLYAGYLTFTPSEGQKFQPFYAYDRIRDVRTGAFFDSSIIEGLEAAAAAGLLPPGFPPLPAGGLEFRATPKTDSHHAGAYYTGRFGMLELFLEGVYQFGKAEDTGMAAGAAATAPYALYPDARYDDYDIKAYAFSGDIAFNMDELVGFGLKPHVGFLYTSGDDDPTDDELNGYTGVTNAQRFSQYFGGENTIIGDTNFLLGSVLYGYLPELYGNGTPVFTGGLENFAGQGNGRGDNPGLTMSSAGITIAPKRFLIYRTNVNSFWWNEDINVRSIETPLIVTPVDSGYVGTEWDNEITLATSPNSFIKGQFSFFFPGEVIEDVTSAYYSVAAPGDGPEADDTAYRLGLEFIWMF